MPPLDPIPVGPLSLQEIETTTGGSPLGPMPPPPIICYWPLPGQFKHPTVGPASPGRRAGSRR